MKISTLIKYVFCALGHPLVFLALHFSLENESLGGMDANFFGQPLFFMISTNVYRLNLLLYIPYALLVYGIWLGFQFLVLHQFRHVSFDSFIARKFTPFYLSLCGIGLINLIFWIIGMEGNAFGFIFALPLMIISLVLIFMEAKIFFVRYS